MKKVVIFLVLIFCASSIKAQSNNSNLFTDLGNNSLIIKAQEEDRNEGYFKNPIYYVEEKEVVPYWQLFNNIRRSCNSIWNKEYLNRKLQSSIRFKIPSRFEFDFSREVRIVFN